MSSTINQSKDKEYYQTIQDYCLKLLSLRPRSKKEIKNKLERFARSNGITLRIVNDVIIHLSSENLINDKGFCRWWIDQRKSFRPKGIRVIKIELLNKGVEKEVIDEVLSDSEKPDEFEMALQVVNKKKYYYKNLSCLKLKSKISDLLYRRGFDWDTTKRVIDSIAKKS